MKRESYEVDEALVWRRAYVYFFVGRCNVFGVPDRVGLWRMKGQDWACSYYSSGSKTLASFRSSQKIGRSLFFRS